MPTVLQNTFLTSLAIIYHACIKHKSRAKQRKYQVHLIPVLKIFMTLEGRDLDIPLIGNIYIYHLSETKRLIICLYYLEAAVDKCVFNHYITMSRKNTLDPALTVRTTITTRFKCSSCLKAGGDWPSERSAEQLFQYPT